MAHDLLQVLGPFNYWIAAGVTSKRLAHGPTRDSPDRPAKRASDAGLVPRCLGAQGTEAKVGFLQVLEG